MKSVKLEDPGKEKWNNGEKLEKAGKSWDKERG
jgi:hypothetical protein